MDLREEAIMKYVVQDRAEDGMYIISKMSLPAEKQ